MYSTCLHCNKPLGSNDVIETLPIGRRIAFDAAKQVVFLWRHVSSLALAQLCICVAARIILDI